MLKVLCALIKDNVMVGTLTCCPTSQRLMGFLHNLPFFPPFLSHFVSHLFGSRMVKVISMIPICLLGLLGVFLMTVYL